MNSPDFSSYQTKIPLEIQADGFVVKTANCEEDLLQTLKLRHLTFIEEGLGQSTESGLDFDKFDHVADHLMIFDLENNKTVGTYRLISSKFSENFYSQNEFTLDEFFKSRRK